MNVECGLPSPNEGQKWCVWREDIHSNQYRMPATFDTPEEAETCKHEFTERGHHQTYTVRPYDEDEVDAILNDNLPD